MVIKNKTKLIMIQLFILFISINLTYEKIMLRKYNIIKRIRWLEESSDIDEQTWDEEITSSDLDIDLEENNNIIIDGTVTDSITEKSTESRIEVAEESYITSEVSNLISDITTSELSGLTSITTSEYSSLTSVITNEETSQTTTASPSSETIPTTTSPFKNDTISDTRNKTDNMPKKSNSSLSTEEICGMVIICSSPVIIIGAAIAYVATCGAAGAAGTAGAAGAAGACGGIFCCFKCCSKNKENKEPTSENSGQINFAQNATDNSLT